MATLALPAPLNAFPAESLFNPASNDCQPNATACLLLSSHSQPRAAIKLADYPVDLLFQDGCLTLKNYALSELLGPRPYVYLKITNGEGRDISDEMFLACTSELRFSTALFLQALALANLSASIYPVHNRVLPVTGFNAVFSFRDFPTGAHTVEDVHSVPLIPRTAHPLPPEESDSSASNHHILSLQLIDGHRPIGVPVVIGRCL